MKKWISEKTIIEVFNFGFEEMYAKPSMIIGGVDKIYHLKDFTNGSMGKFKNYSVGRFEDEFGVIVSFG